MSTERTATSNTSHVVNGIRAGLDAIETGRPDVARRHIVSAQKGANALRTAPIGHGYGVEEACAILTALWGRVPKVQRNAIIREWLIDGCPRPDGPEPNELGRECREAAAL